MSVVELLTISGMVIAIIAFVFIVQKKNNDKRIAQQNNEADDSQQ